MKQRLLSFVIALLAAFLLVPLGATARMNMGIINLEVGETKQITSEPSTYYSVSGSWSKSGEAISIVSRSDRSCTVRGLKEGTATLEWSGLINTTWEDMYWTVNVTAAPVKVTKIELNKTQMTLIVNNQEQLSATVSPSNATDKSVTWSSSSESVATVSNSGNVTAKNAGNATITCKANDGSGVSASCSVTVIEQPVDPTKISIVENLTMKLEDTYRIPYTLTPSNASTTVTWDSDNKSVATISSDGNVTPVSIGTANIVATTANGLTASCELTVIDNVKPLKVSIDKIFVGDLYSMMLNTDESLWGWGCNTYNRVIGGTQEYILRPVKISDDIVYVSGESCKMILKKDGSLWATGSIPTGMFNDISWDYSTFPGTLAKKVMEDVASVAVAEFHIHILKQDGSLWACGQNIDGVLGDGTTEKRTTPVKVMEGVKSVFAGYHHTMALKTDGSLWTWGQNKYGQLGDGTTERKLNPIKLMDGGVASVAASYEHTMILKKDGTLWACGDNYHGQLGDGTKSRRITPVQVMSGVKQVSSKWLHTMILKTDGTLWACGKNQYGELGDGTTIMTATPVKVMDDVASVEAATYHTLMLKTDGSLWACGDNRSGQLGDGTTVSRSFPVKIAEYGVGVTNITLNKTSLSLQAGQSETLTATILPSDATDKTVSWTSSDTSITNVDSSGKVTAKSKGSATITCKANDGSGVEVTCNVTVTNPKPDKIALPSEATVTAGQTITLTPTVTPANAEYALTWTSDDETVATVNSAGVVMGVKKGQTFINVETDNGKAAYCKLTVTAAEPAGIELPKNATVYVGGTLLLTPTITPEGAETTLTWKSDDETVVRVDVTGLLTGVAEGLALVTVTTANGQTSNACKVKVEQDPSGISDVLVGVKANFPVYTLSGQRLDAPRKGINIIGGKKVVVK